MSRLLQTETISMAAAVKSAASFGEADVCVFAVPNDADIRIGISDGQALAQASRYQLGVKQPATAIIRQPVAEYHFATALKTDAFATVPGVRHPESIGRCSSKRPRLVKLARSSEINVPFSSR